MGLIEGKQRRFEIGVQRRTYYCIYELHFRHRNITPSSPESRPLISYKGIYAKRLRQCYAMLCSMRLKASNASGAFDMTIRYPGYPRTLPLR